MLNHYGWARRLTFAIALIVLFATSAVRGAIVTGMSTSSPSFQSPTSYSISGFVYVDSAQHGIMLPGEWGLPGVTVNLTEYSPSDPSTIVNIFTTTTGSGGYYDFTGLPTGDFFSVTEVQPSNYRSTANSVGKFLSSTGATLTAPTGEGGNPANGVQDPGNPFAISSILLPSPTGPFAPGGNGVVYSAVGYNFGQFPLTLISGGSGGSQLSITPDVPTHRAQPLPLEPCQPRWRSREATTASSQGLAAEFLACRQQSRTRRRGLQFHRLAGCVALWRAERIVHCRHGACAPRPDHTHSERRRNGAQSRHAKHDPLRCGPGLRRRRAGGRQHDFGGHRSGLQPRH